MSEVAKGNAGSGPRMTKSPSAYLQRLIGKSNTTSNNAPP